MLLAYCVSHRFPRIRHIYIKKRKQCADGLHSRPILMNIHLSKHVKIIKGMFTQWQHSKNNHRWQRYIVLVSVRQKLIAYSHQEAWQILSTVSIPNIMNDEICSCGRLCTWQFSSTVGILLIHVCGGKEKGFLGSWSFITASMWPELCVSGSWSFITASMWPELCVSGSCWLWRVTFWLHCQPFLCDKHVWYCITPNASLFQQGWSSPGRGTIKEKNHNCDLFLRKEGTEPQFIRGQALASQPMYSLFNVSYLKVQTHKPFSQSLCCHILPSVFQTCVQHLWQKTEKELHVVSLLCADGQSLLFWAVIDKV